MSIFLRNLFIVLVLCFCIYLLIYQKMEKREDFNQNTPRILIVIISASSKENRWKEEKDTWVKYMKSFPNIDCVFTECQENFTLKENCIESFKPGIFQKTILTLSRAGDNYDYYIRANLSTFYIFDYLTMIIKKKMPINLPTCAGFCTNWDGVQGTGIVMNKLAKNILVTEGRKHENFNNANIADDVLISKIFKENNVQQICLDFMYLWNFGKSNEENLKNIKKRMTPTIRLKTKNSNKYQEVSHFLLQQYYS